MLVSRSSTPVLFELLERFPELRPMESSIRQSIDAICRSYRSGGKLLVCGNGGSAADSEHIVGELMKGFVLPRALSVEEANCLCQSGCPDGAEIAARLQRGVPAIALTGHISLSTAIMNDTDPLMGFAQQVFVLGRPGDIFLGISTSGNAGNVLNAVKVARAFGLVTIGMTGSAPGKIDPFCDILMKVPTESKPYRVQEYHLPIYHAICLLVEEELFGNSHEDI